jgi:carbon-monoxide dehydrogenase large subunit
LIAGELLATKYIGQPVRRKEDLRFLTGHGCFVDDVALPNTAYAAFVRSPHAHARIVRIDCARARKLPGVLAVLTAKDWIAAGLGELRVKHPVPFSDGRPSNTVARPALANDRVCHVGDNVAVVIAEMLHQAQDAAEAVDVEYDPLPASADLRRALDPETIVIHRSIGTNLHLERRIGNEAEVEKALRTAHHVSEIEIIANRLAPSPIEPRAYLGHYDVARDHHTLWTNSQAPHYVRSWLAEDSLRVPEHKVRVVAPDVGGGFGVKFYHYPEQPIVLWASRIVGRPVRWTSTRSEAFCTDTQARDHYSKARMGFDRDGKIVGLYVDTIANIGAYESTFAASIAAGAHLSVFGGPYSNRNLYVRLRTAYTNTVPIDAYRGAGHPEAISILERLLEMAAHQMGWDIIDLRARNLIQPDQFPYKSPTGTTYDSGNYPGLLAKLEALPHYRALREEQARLRSQGVLLGIGVSSFIENNGGGMSSRRLTALGSTHGTWEVATVRVHPSGKATVLAGTHSQGQGHETAYAQIAAEHLGCAIEDIEVAEGDTDRIAFGNGTWGDRSLVTAGAAIKIAAERVVAKGKRLAAHLLECAAEDLEYRDGRYTVRGTDRAISFQEVARQAYLGANYPSSGFELGLEETAFYDQPMEPSPAAPTSAAMHMAIVIVDAETGRVTLRDFVAVDDCGHIVNPMIVEGQIHGGLAQGLGEGLMEVVRYDTESGQLLSGSFMDYAMPRASDFPRPILGGQVTPAPGNPLGAKGGGESGTRGSQAALCNAVVDALWHLGVRHIDRPLTPLRVWQAIQIANQQRR